MRASIYMAALAVSIAGAAAPASAQQCYDSTTCPAGTTCVNGVCQQTAVPPPGYGGSVTVQGGAGGGQVQVQAQGPQVQQPQPQPQPQVYGQPQQQPVYQQPQPQPREETSHMVGLIVSGAVLLGASWITNMIVSAFAGTVDTASSDPEDWDEFRYIGLIPVLGPWIQMAVKPTPFDHDDWAYFLMVDGILQAAGLTMLIIGAAVPVTRTVYAENGEREGIDLAIAPSPGGINLLGRF